MNDAPSFIWQSARSQGSVSAIEATQLCIDSLSATGDSSDAFLSLVDYTASDWLFVNDSSVASPDLLSFVSMAGSVQNETVNVRVDELAASEIGEAVLQFAAQTDIAYAVNLEVKDSVCNTTALAC